MISTAWDLNGDFSSAGSFGLDIRAPQAPNRRHILGQRSTPEVDVALPMARRALKRPAGSVGDGRWIPKESEEELSFEAFQQSWLPLPETDLDYYFSSYARLGIHEDMLKDEVRTGSYMEAIDSSQALFAGKTVLDVGSGTGILCLFAAQAGAAKVIGIERSDVAQKATKIAEENGFGDVISYIQGQVEEVELPVEKVDIIISEWMGYFLMFESMLDCVLFARDKWLRPGGQMFPDYARLYMAGIEDADYKEEKLGFWRHVRGFDLSPVAELAIGEPLSDIVDAAAMVTESQCIFQMDLRKVTCAELDFSAPFTLKVLRQDFVHALTALELAMSVWSEMAPLELRSGVPAVKASWQRRRKEEGRSHTFHSNLEILTVQVGKQCAQLPHL
eukprot:s759_g2.t1